VQDDIGHARAVQSSVTSNDRRPAMTRLLVLTSVLFPVLLGANVPAFAVDRTFQIEVENSLKGTVPSNWWLRASWRDQTLVVFVSPSAQESFNLWYDTGRQKETLENLCKAIPVAIWSQINPSQDIAVEQVVGGNGGKGSFQLSCRKYLAEKSTD
jgi:nitrate reductase NapE component